MDLGIDVDVLKEAHRELIDINPRDVLLKHDALVDDGEGGKTRTSGYRGKVHGRLYLSGTTRQPNREVIADAGIREDDNTWGFVCEAEMQQVDPETGVPVLAEGNPVMIPTAVDAGAFIDDTFDTEFGTFHVVAVHPRQTGGEIWGWDAIVEVRG